MRIDTNQGAQPLPENGRTSHQSPASAGSCLAASSGPGDDEAKLSSAHVQVQALAAQASQLPEMRVEKVNALREVVLGGNYQLSSDQVAEAVFAHMLVKPAA